MELPRPPFARAVPREYLASRVPVGKRHVVAVDEEPHHRAVEFRFAGTGFV